MGTEVVFSCLEAEDVEFAILTETVPFEEAKSLCSGAGATLASIDSATQFGFVQALAQEAGVTDIGWVGLEGEDSASGAASSVLVYNFLDQNADEAFFATAEQFPWRNNEPSSSPGCIQMQFGFINNNGWDAVNCVTSQNHPICKRRCQAKLEFEEEDIAFTALAGVGVLVAFIILILIFIFLKSLKEIKSELQELRNDKQEIENFARTQNTNSLELKPGELANMTEASNSLSMSNVRTSGLKLLTKAVTATEVEIPSENLPALSDFESEKQKAKKLKPNVISKVKSQKNLELKAKAEKSEENLPDLSSFEINNQNQKDKEKEKDPIVISKKKSKEDLEKEQKDDKNDDYFVRDSFLSI